MTRISAAACAAMVAATCLPDSLQVGSDRLLDAIERVESMDGRSSSNLYQMQRVYYRDWCRIYGHRFTEDGYAAASTSRYTSRRIIREWWAYWVWRGRPCTEEGLARMHNGGPNGPYKKSTYRYWIRVKRELDKDR